MEDDVEGCSLEELSEMLNEKFKDTKYKFSKENIKIFLSEFEFGKIEFLLNLEVEGFSDAFFVVVYDQCLEVEDEDERENAILLTLEFLYNGKISEDEESFPENQPQTFFDRKYLLGDDSDVLSCSSKSPKSSQQLKAVSPGEVEMLFKNHNAEEIAGILNKKFKDTGYKFSEENIMVFLDEYKIEKIKFLVNLKVEDFSNAFFVVVLDQCLEIEDEDEREGAMLLTLEF